MQKINHFEVVNDQKIKIVIGNKCNVFEESDFLSYDYLLFIEGNLCIRISIKTIDDKYVVCHSIVDFKIKEIGDYSYKITINI